MPHLQCKVGWEFLTNLVFVKKCHFCLNQNLSQNRGMFNKFPYSKKRPWKKCKIIKMFHFGNVKTKNSGFQFQNDIVSKHQLIRVKKWKKDQKKNKMFPLTQNKQGFGLSLYKYFWDFKFASWFEKGKNLEFLQKLPGLENNFSPSSAPTAEYLQGFLLPLRF